MCSAAAFRRRHCLRALSQIGGAYYSPVLPLGGSRRGVSFAAGRRASRDVTSIAVVYLVCCKWVFSRKKLRTLLSSRITKDVHYWYSRHGSARLVLGAFDYLVMWNVSALFHFGFWSVACNTYNIGCKTNNYTGNEVQSKPQSSWFFIGRRRLWQTSRLVSGMINPHFIIKKYQFCRIFVMNDFWQWRRQLLKGKIINDGGKN